MNNEISIYVHWPFCLSKCPYCDFNSHVERSIDQKQWQNAYIHAVKNISRYIDGKVIKSIFFGGGTPSLMHPKTIESILHEVSSISNIDTAEITLEANPTSSNKTIFQDFRNAGINRISIGIQSLEQTRLKQLGREHSALEAIDAIEAAAACFSNYSFDMIYATSEQSLEQWQNELMRAMDYAGPHISLYQLTIEKGTKFYKDYKENKLNKICGDLAADMYHWTDEYLKSFGYEGYEISNYSKNGLYSVHNVNYWNYGDYIGIGPGAHSRIAENFQTHALAHWSLPTKWMQEVHLESMGFQTIDILSEEEVIEEIVMMGLRLTSGINSSRLKALTNKKLADILNLENVKLYEDSGFLEFTNDLLKLTKSGLLMHSYIVPRILA